MIAALLQATIPNISTHIKNIYDEGELTREATVKDFLIVQQEGQIEFREDFGQDMVWGAQKQIAEVFSIDRSVATRYINKIMQDGEVDRKSNVQKMHIAISNKPVDFCSLYAAQPEAVVAIFAITTIGS